MAESKIQIKIGIVEFSSEGEQGWVSAQLDKILKQAPELLKLEIPLAKANPVGSGEKQSNVSIKPTNLALFLKEKAATTVQTKKFLATAAFLQLGGKTRQTTADISRSLKDSNQTKLNNPSDCLNQNVSKGFCEKDGSSGFFVTDAGFAELNIA